NATDELGARANQRNFLNPAPIDFAYDFNRDKKVDATDQLIARGNQTNFLTALKLISAPAPSAAAAATASAVSPYASRRAAPRPVGWAHVRGDRRHLIVVQASSLQFRAGWKPAPQ